jgi:hypothetical protein
MGPIRIISTVEEDGKLLVSRRFMKFFGNDNYKGELI